MSANSRQVAGKHYEGMIQHWDFVAANNLDYFQAQITRYVGRCKMKNGRQDLEKAGHYLDKYLEVVLGQGPIKKFFHRAIEAICKIFEPGKGTPVMTVGEYCLHQPLDEDQRHFFYRVTSWTDIGPEELISLKNDLNEYMNHLYPQPEGDAGPGYVNQDR